jgi:hypothetical protein
VEGVDVSESDGDREINSTDSKNNHTNATFLDSYYDGDSHMDTPTTPINASKARIFMFPIVIIQY